MIEDREYDYIIIGQGLCGTFLSWYLLKAGKKVLVIDESQPFTATKVASGVINPVTGRRIVKTWRIEELLPFCWNIYNEFGDELGVKLIKHCNIIDFHPSLQMKEAFEKRLAENAEYLTTPNDLESWEQFFRFHFRAGEVDPCYLIDLNIMLDKWREKLKEQKALLEEALAWDNCKVDEDGINYKSITAKKTICCEGVAGFDNPYFKNLPYSRMKGEVIIAEIKNLPKTNIYKQGISIVPWKDDLFWIGSSYEWQFNDVLPTPAFRKRVEEQLRYFLKVPFTVVDHLASERPANMERRPFVGLHPVHTSVGILNGMGTKGCSLAPFLLSSLHNILLTEQKYMLMQMYDVLKKHYNEQRINTLLPTFVLNQNIMHEQEELYKIPARFRRIENLHIVFWLIKDLSWAMLWKPLGVIMIVPTIGAALLITWQTRHIKSELLHNLAVDFWIVANGYWMITEFFSKDDSLRYYTIIPFSIGLIIIAYYYLIVRRLEKRENHNTTV